MSFSEAPSESSRLNILVAATLLGYFSNMVSIVGTGAILVVFAFVAAAFGIGYLASLRSWQLSTYSLTES